MTGERGAFDRGVDAAAEVIRLGIRPFASPPGQPRARRATDVVVLVPSLLVLAVLVAVYPPSSLELLAHPCARRRSRAGSSRPGGSSPTSPGSGRSSLFVADARRAPLLDRRPDGRCARRRRPRRARLRPSRDRLLARRLDALARPIARRRVPGRAARGGRSPSWGPSRPISSRPLRASGDWIIVLGVVGNGSRPTGTPGGALAALLVGLIGGVDRQPRPRHVGRAPWPRRRRRRAWRSSACAPSASRRKSVRSPASSACGRRRPRRPAAPREGVRARRRRQPARRSGSGGGSAYRSAGPAIGSSGLHAAEREAFVTLLARQAGLPTRDVVTAGETAERRRTPRARRRRDPARRAPRGARRRRTAPRCLGGARAPRRAPDRAPADRPDDDRSRRRATWASSSSAERRSLPTSTSSSSIAPSCSRRPLPLPDRRSGARRGDRRDRLDAASPSSSRISRTQRSPRPLRRALKAADVDVDDLREQAAEAVGAEAPELVKLRRVSLRSGDPARAPRRSPRTRS